MEADDVRFSLGVCGKTHKFRPGVEIELYDPDAQLTGYLLGRLWRQPSLWAKNDELIIGVHVDAIGKKTPAEPESKKGHGADEDDISAAHFVHLKE